MSPLLQKKKCCCGSAACIACAPDYFGEPVSLEGVEQVMVSYCFVADSPGSCSLGGSSPGAINTDWYQDQFLASVVSYTPGSSIVWGNSGHTSTAAPMGYRFGSEQVFGFCQEPIFLGGDSAWRWGFNSTPFERLVNGSSAILDFTAPTVDPDPYDAFLHPKCFMRWICPGGEIGDPVVARLRTVGGSVICYQEGSLVVDVRLQSSNCHPECNSQSIPDPSDLCGL